MHVLRNIDRQCYHIDFVAFSEKSGDFDKEIKSLGSQIFRCASPASPLRHRREFRAMLEQFGPFDVVHSHGVTWSGSVLDIAKRLGVPIRIAHSHNDIRQSLPKDIVKRIYTKWSIRKSKECATNGLACSRMAAASYFGKDWESDPRWNVYYCGEDFAPFREKIDARAIRESLRLPEDASVIGHVGSFRNHQKNHRFLLSVAREVINLCENTYFLLVGDGALRLDIEKEARLAGLGERMRFVGMRSDVPRLMLGAMDAFLFPSLYEGLGLVMVEAQAAGLPCVCSDVIPEEANVVPSLVMRMSLTQPAIDWAHAIVDMRKSNQLPSRKEALKRVEGSSFNISTTLGTLERIYSGG